MNDHEGERKRKARAQDTWERLEAERRDRLLRSALNEYEESPTAHRTHKGSMTLARGIFLINEIHRLSMMSPKKRDLDPRVVALREEGYVSRSDLFKAFRDHIGQKNRTKTKPFDDVITGLLNEKIIEKDNVKGVKTRRSKEGKKQISAFYRLWQGAEPIGDLDWKAMKVDTLQDLLQRARLAFMKDATLILGYTDLEKSSRNGTFSSQRQYQEAIKFFHRQGEESFSVIVDHVDKRMEEVFGREVLDLESERLYSPFTGRSCPESDVLRKPWLDTK